MDCFIGTGEYLEDFEADVQASTLKTLEAFKRADGEYLFAGHYDGTSLLGLARGKNMLQVRDAQGQWIMKDLIALAQNGGGFYTYQMPAESGQPPLKKTSYALPIPGWNWYVGMGFFQSTVDQYLDQQNQIFFPSLAWGVGLRLGLLGFLVLLGILIMRRVGRGLDREIQELHRFFSSAFQGQADHRFKYDEFEKIGEFARQMVEKRTQAEEQLVVAGKMQAVAQLASGVAHDFNNMLGAVMGAASILESQLGPDHQKTLKIILNSAQRAAELSHKLLALGRQNQLTDLSWVSLHRILDSTLGILQQSQDPRIQIRGDWKASRSELWGNPGDVQGIFMNLGINAIHAMPRGGTLSFQTQDMPGPEGDPGVEVRVSDTGTGMPPDVLARIFEPFFTTKPPEKGTGLGLAMVMKSVKNLGGQIGVQSKLDQGTEFVLWFPSRLETQKTSNKAEETPRLKGPILLVEDEEALRDVVSQHLRNWGAQVILARDGQEALELFKARPRDFQGVILDYQMPRMNGRDCFEALQKINSSVQAVLISGYITEGDLKALREMGISGIISKPFTSQELWKGLKQAWQLS